MKLIQNEIPYDPETDYITVIPLADFHIGDPQSDKKLIKELLEQIRKEKNTYCILGGDLMNTALATSVSDSYSEVLTPLEQINKCVELFAPIKDKILGVVGGNHEARAWKNAGIDMTALFSKQLGIDDKYSDSTAVVQIKCGLNIKQRPHSYTIYLTHGSGGGRAWGGKINRLVDYGNICDADIYVCGHTHSPAVVRQGFIRVNPTNGTLTEVDKLFVNTATSLQYGGYGDVQGYKPSSRKYPELRLSTRAVKKAEAIL